MNHRLLYITHTPWGWIKQRPQFIAEGLDKFFDIDVLYRKSNHAGQGLNTRGNETLRIRGFRHLPFERIPMLPIKPMYAVNRWLWNRMDIRLEDYDYVWLTDPLLWWNVSEGKTPTVIYDCMDDVLEFPYTLKYPKLKQFTEECEQDLVTRADHVFCSSSYLASQLQKRYDTKRHIDIINNAISDDMCAQYATQHATANNASAAEPCIVYIGTISEWFDFPLILRTLDRYPTLRVKLYGPIRTSNLPHHERLEFMGSIAHDKVYDAMNSATALVMPFVVNDLIRSVNPVKLYEYILSAKPVAATRYGETLQFADHVTLYSSDDEFYSFIEECVMRPARLDTTAMRDFAKKNTWSARCQQIADIIKH